MNLKHKVTTSKKSFHMCTERLRESRPLQGQVPKEGAIDLADLMPTRTRAVAVFEPKQCQRRSVIIDVQLRSTHANPTR